MQLLGRCLRILDEPNTLTDDVTSDEPNTLTDDLTDTLEDAFSAPSLPLARVMLKSYTNFFNFNSSSYLFRIIDENNHPGLPDHSSQIAELLLECKCDPNQQDEDKRTPLHVVYHQNILKLLLEKGADPNIQDRYGRTPFHDLDVDVDEHTMPCLLYTSDAADE